MNAERDPENLEPYGAQNHPLPQMQEVGARFEAPRVIGLCGYAGSGKSTVAEALEREGYTRLRFGKGLKTMLRAFLVCAGLDGPTIARMIEGDLKEQPHPALMGQTPRHAMQTLGQGWGRDAIHPDFWVQVTIAEANRILAAGGRVVIEDVRQLNEAAAVKGTEVENALGVRELWHVKGRRAHLPGAAATHVTEADPARLQPDLVLHNTRGIDHLERQALEIILG